MRSELKANQALADYNQKEWEQRQKWQKVLAAPAKPGRANPVAKQGFSFRSCFALTCFSKLLKVA